MTVRRKGRNSARDRVVRLPVRFKSNHAPPGGPWGVFLVPPPKTAPGSERECSPRGRRVS